MNSFVPRVVPSIALLVSLHAGCAHRNGSSQAAIADTMPSQPSHTGPVTAEEIQRRPGEPIEQILASRFPGVEIRRTVEGLSIRIRGTNSYAASNEPLYVLDGNPIEPGPSGSLTGINLYDIESIDVLKDPVSTSMYGVRGANGVIVLKTKRSD